MEKIQTKITVGSPIQLIRSIRAQIQDAIRDQRSSIIGISDESIRRIEVAREGDSIVLRIDFNDPIGEIA